MVYVRVLAALSSVPQRTDEIERIILSDPTLCYRLLRLVNSALYSLSSHVTSIRTALVLIGYDGIRKLVTVALASMYADRQPKVLSLLALERAHVCEAIAPLLNRHPAELYLLGMLSLIDVMMQAPMQGILAALPLSAEIKGALGGERNELGKLLSFLRSYEAGSWAECDEFRHSLGITEEHAASVYLEAIHWAATALVS
jgi:EAL and modified HD-GYP domain-containing signal transduction protein